MFQSIGDWNNDLAKGMMSIEQEMEAFGEKMPEPQYNRDTPASGEVEED